MSTAPEALAQHGIAPTGYWPASYRGDTFTGRVVATDPATDTLTLEYTKGSERESFSVSLDGGCSVPSKTGEPMHAKNIPSGTVLTAFYTTRTTKHNDDKTKVNVAIAIVFLEWQGKPVSEETRHKLRPCGSNGDWWYYRAFVGKGPGAAVQAPLQLTIPAPGKSKDHQ